MAHKKGGGAVGTNRDSNSKRLGVKRYGGQAVSIGDIIIRQKGSHFYSGQGTRRGNDFTIYAITNGKVEFKKQKGCQIVSVHG